jgi:hypothetical protein
MYWSEPIVQARLTNGRNVRLAYPHVLCLCLALGGEDSSIGLCDDIGRIFEGNLPIFECKIETDPLRSYVSWNRIVR